MDLDHDACYRAIATRDARFDGRLYVGVKTTGVYCRPICPARTPKARNVVFFPSAAGAQAGGFRPCLRCRPETAPDLAAWRGTSNTVSRALALIEGGALDQGDVEALAGRLGVGERQLRRLFRQHLGASPTAVAQTRRVLLAKQLIHQTALPMSQVALGAGFGSVRRFNETFQRLYRRPPALLRRTTGEARGLVTGEWLSLSLPFRPPYDWDGMLEFLAFRAIAGVEHADASSYVRTIAVGDQAGLLRVSPLDGDRLRAEIGFPDLSFLPGIIARVRRVFDLAVDPAPIAEHLGRDPLLAPLVARRPGLRAPGAWDGFELAVRAILGQQVTVAVARTLAGRLAVAFGEPLPGTLRAAAPGLTHVFPSAVRLASADLTGLPMPGARIKALSSLARAVVDDPGIFGPTRSLDEAVARLKTLPGVGEWTAQYIALRALREPDAFPAADVGLMRALADAEGRRPSPAELLERARAWRPWRAYAAQHLWTSLAKSSVAQRDTSHDSESKAA